MPTGFEYQFPAIKGLQAKKEYYIAMCPLGLIPKLFQVNEEDLPPEFRAQRILNKIRIPEITKYINDNPDDYVFSSLTASIDGSMNFIPSPDKNIGKLCISMESRILINDGQHRRAAIEEALKINPELKKETISIVFFADKGLEKSQQMFSDLNKHAVNTTKSIGILYDHRDPLSLLVKKLIDTIPLLRSFTDKEVDNLPKLSSKIFTLTNLHDSISRTLDKRKGQTITNEDEKFVMEYWTTLCNIIKEWKAIQNKQMSALELRKNYTCAHGVVVAAFGILGNYFYCNYKNQPSMYTPYLQKLNTIDWSRANLHDWNGRSIANGGKISKTEQNIRLTCNKIKLLVGISLNEDETALEQSFISQIGE